MLRVDRALLKSVPLGPGVYLMYSENGLLIYVGKAKSLRKRLASYWRATPDEGRKLDRMRRAVYRIEWQETPSEKAALLMENSLLREHRPLFNVLNTRPEAYPYLLLQEGKLVKARVLCRLFPVRNPETLGKQDSLYGAFRSRRIPSLAARTIFELVAERQKRAFPTDDRTGSLQKRGWINLEKGEVAALKSFLSGTRSHFLSQLYAELWDLGCFEDPLMAKKLDGDFALLRTFFESGPRRNLLLKRKLHLDSSLIEQDKLDDLIVEFNFRDSGDCSFPV